MISPGAQALSTASSAASGTGPGAAIMASDPISSKVPKDDEWLEAQCRRLEATGNDLADTIGEINSRLEGELGRRGRRSSVRQRVQPEEIQKAQEACGIFREIQNAVQDALFDTEHELRELRERDVSPAELLIDGEGLVRQYRFLRRRARVLDGLLAYLPSVGDHALVCVEKLRRLEEHDLRYDPIMVPDTGFALIAIEHLRDAENVT